MGNNRFMVVSEEKDIIAMNPFECERLQGLPDNWTEGGSDTARYRAIGNGMAQPCADYVMSKVVKDIKGGSICDL